MGKGPRGRGRSTQGSEVRVKRVDCAYGLLEAMTGSQQDQHDMVCCEKTTCL